MSVTAVAIRPIAPAASHALAVAGLFIDERDRDVPGIAIPRARLQLVVRFGPATRTGLDVHVMGVRQKVHRKFIRGGQRTVAARLRMGTPESLFGVPASALADRIVPLEDLWGVPAAQELFERLAAARNTEAAAAILQRGIAERLRIAAPESAPTQLARHAAERLSRCTQVSLVAAEVGVSERHLRRVFLDAVGVSPKAFATLARFRRALRAARRDPGLSWASIAIDAGYYDQAHLNAEFRAIAGVTPRMLVDELGAAFSFG